MLKATPVTTPGSAIGRTTKRFTVPLPKKSKPLSAKATRVPKMAAMIVDPAATIIELSSAVRIGWYVAANSHHWNEKVAIGQLEIFDSLNEFRISTNSGTYIKIRMNVTRARRMILLVLESLNMATSAPKNLCGEQP